ncbi:MAG: hypothetical protein WBE80_02490 [Methylocella sp.]
MRRDHAIRNPNHFTKIGSVLVAPAAPVLTSEERAALEGLLRSTRMHHRTRFTARAVLMAADRAATRAVAREVKCVTGAAAQWRVRHAKERAIGPGG